MLTSFIVTKTQRAGLNPSTDEGVFVTMQIMTTFYIARHGETEWNVKKLLQGQTDSPLTEKGLTQAAGLAEKLRHIYFDVVFSSDLLRAKRTAEVIAIERKLAVNTNALLRERNFGVYEGRTGEDFRKENAALIEQFNQLTAAEQSRFKYAHDIESNDEMIARFLTFIREVAVTYEGKTILIVTHGSLMRAVLIHLAHPVSKHAIENAAYFKLLSDGVDFSVVETNGIVASDVKGTSAIFHPRVHHNSNKPQ